MRLDGPGQEDWGFHVEVLHPVLHHGQFDGDDACHFDRAAEGDLPVALAEVEVAHAEFGTGDVHRQERAAAAGEVFDVAVSAVLWPPRDRTGAFFSNLLLYVRRSRACVHVLRLWGLRNDAFKVGCADQLGFALVPGGEDVCAGSAAQNAWVDEAWEANMWEVA